mgnify:FL=1
MRVLVTGGSGVVGEAAVRALLRRGHAVRLLARHAEDDARVWPTGVEPWPGDVTRPETLAGSGDGCDAVLHVVGIVDEKPPAVTFQAVNVDGTRHVVDEAGRAGVAHLVYVSSLGAERGASPYHRSKHAGEEIARTFAGRWTVVRPANVYGPGDEVISLLLRMVRTLPAIPVIAGGDQPFQPVWADDVGEALALACERDDLAGRSLDLAGTERTTMNDLLDRFGALTGRRPVRLPMPGLLARLGLAAAEAVGIDLPINASQLTMLAEGNLIEDPAANALTAVFGIAPLSLDDGLARLLDALPEQLPGDGTGALHHNRYWADVVAPTVGAATLFARFCRRFQEVTPAQMDLEAEPGTPTAVLARGQTVTMALPMRGTVQVRVAELDDRSLTLQTVEGHPLAGAVRFTFAPPGSGDAPADGAAGFRFQVEVFDRAASAFDQLAMAVVGHRLQRANWEEIVQTVVDESGGRAPLGVQVHEETLEGEAAERVDALLRELALARKRDDNARAIAAEDPAEALDAVAAPRAGS